MDRKKKVLITMLVLGALAAVGGGTYASFNAVTTNPGNTFQTGSIFLSDDKNTTATTCFSYGTLTAGQFTNGNQWSLKHGRWSAAAANALHPEQRDKLQRRLQPREYRRGEVVYQPEDEAGSLYGNIIYDKAPIVMRQLEAILGADGLRDGLREYLNRYAWSNATWTDLIKILDARTDEDLTAWSHTWVEQPGRPTVA